MAHGGKFDLKKVVAEDYNRHKRKASVLVPRSLASAHHADDGTSRRFFEKKQPRVAAAPVADAASQKSLQLESAADVALADAPTYHDRAAERRREEGREAAEPVLVKGLDFNLLRQTRALGTAPTPQSLIAANVLKQPHPIVVVAAAAAARDARELARNIAAFYSPPAPTTTTYSLAFDWDPTPPQIAPDPSPAHASGVFVSRSELRLYKACRWRAEHAAAGGEEEDLFQGAGSYEPAARGASLDEARRRLERSLLAAKTAVDDTELSEPELDKAVSAAAEDNITTWKRFSNLTLEELVAFRDKIVLALARKQNSV